MLNEIREEARKHLSLQYKDINLLLLRLAHIIAGAGTCLGKNNGEPPCTAHPNGSQLFLKLPFPSVRFLLSHAR